MKKEIYLIHGPNAAEIQTERIRIVDKLLPADQRDENLMEFVASANRSLTLSALLPDLMSELATVSFFPGARRVAIVNDLSDFWSATKKKAAKKSAKKGKKPARKPIDPIERLIAFFEEDFESESSAAIFTVLEDPDKRRQVDKRKKLAAWISKNGHLISFTSQPLIFRLDDAILSRNLTAALGIFREGFRKGQTQQAMTLFSAILRSVHFLLQAKIVSAGQQKQISKELLIDEFLPADGRNNLLKIHPYPQGKYLKAARYFSVTDLTNALKDLYEINRYLIPVSTDPYVADVGFLMEKLLIKLCTQTA